MAIDTNKRNFPNDYFAWYNDDNRIAIVNKQTSTSDSDGITAGEYDTYSDSDVDNGIRIHYRSKYPKVQDIEDDMHLDLKLDSGLNSCVICFIKASLYEDNGNLEVAAYYRKMYEKMMREYPTRRSGVRNLSVPRL